MTKRMAGTQLLLDIIGVTSNPEMGGGHQGGICNYFFEEEGGTGSIYYMFFNTIIPISPR